MNEPITYYELKVSPFELLHIKELKVNASINNHTTLKLKASLSETQEDQDIHTKSNTPIEVYALTTSGKTTLFWGIITKIKVRQQSFYYELYIEAKSYTYLMDIKRKNRSFQDEELDLNSLVKSVTKEYQKISHLLEIENRPVKRLWMQYQETDWEFIKRVASYYNVGLFPYVALEGIHFFIGTPRAEDKTINFYEYTVTKHIQQYNAMLKNDVESIREIDVITYEIKSYDLLELGDHINFKGHLFYVSQLTYEIVNGILENTYIVQLKEGQQQARIYHERLKGVSLEGEVVAVTGDKIKVKLDIDKKESECPLYWFTYSTVAASPDGSGWYFMPELKDRVRVYFPTSDEKDSFALSCIQRIEGDPDVKYIATIYDKKIIFKKDSVTITSNGEATIVLKEEGAISIIGSHSVSVNASENITMRAEDSLIISGKESVSIKCDKGGKVILTEGGEVQLKGTEVKIN